MTEINVKGMDALKQALAEVKVSPAMQTAMSEAVRQVTGVMAVGALGLGQEYLRQAHERRMAERSRCIVTEEDLAALGIKRLPT